MGKRVEWKRYANGCGYCAQRKSTGQLLPWTFSSQKRDVWNATMHWAGADLYLKIADDIKVVRVTVAEAP